MCAPEFILGMSNCDCVKFAIFLYPETYRQQGGRGGTEIALCVCVVFFLCVCVCSCVCARNFYVLCLGSVFVPCMYSLCIFGVCVWVW